MGSKKLELSMGLIDEIRKQINITKYLILIFIGDMIRNFYMLYWLWIANPSLPQELFWVVASMTMSPYLVSTIMLILKFQRLRLEGYFVKLQEKLTQTIDLSEAYIQLAGAKPEHVQSLVDSIRHVQQWNYSNKQLEYLQKLENKLDEFIQQQQKPIEVKT